MLQSPAPYVVTVSAEMAYDLISGDDVMAMNTRYTGRIAAVIPASSPGSPPSCHRRRWRSYVAGTLSAAVLGVIAVSGAPAASAAYYTGCRWGTSQLRFNVDNTSQNARTAINQASDNFRNNTSAKVTNISTYSTWAAQNADFGFIGWEGKAWWNCDKNGIIYDSQTRLNNAYLSGKPVEQLRVVWLHEMGHSLGLDHSPRLSDVMHDSASEAYFSGTRWLSSDDRFGINNLYYGR